VAKLLGFESVSENSMDSVSDRDFAIEFLSSAAVFMMHISRLAEELVLWSSEEFSLIELSDAFTTGSSLMPQKKNPDVAELMRGKTGRVYGNLMGLLTTMKGLPLAYNRDMQEDKAPVFDTADTIRLTLNVLIQMLPRVKFNVVRMRETADAAFSTATDIAEYLVKKGIPFRTAHEITGKIVRHCIDKGKTFFDLSLKEYKAFSKALEKDIFTAIKTTESVKAKKSYGGTSPEAVKRQIKDFREKHMK
jgi:argininosuccinate lyase